MGFEPYVNDQSSFDYVAPTPDAEIVEDNVDPETGEIIEDDKPIEI